MTIAKHGWKVWLIVGVVAGAALVALGFAALAWQIGSSVRATGDAAVQEYGGDRVDALIALAGSSAQGYGSRNRAVWALGQLGDARALPFLEKEYTGEPCDHGRMLCQRELQKAIRLCRGGTNATAVVWRHAFILDRGR